MRGSIQREARKILTPEDISSLGKIEYADNIVKNCQAQVLHIEAEIERKEIYKKKTYQNYMEEIISKEEYLTYVKEFDLSIGELRKNLEQLKSRTFFMSYAPLPIVGADSCPVRAYAIEGLPGFGA